MFGSEILDIVIGLILLYSLLALLAASIRETIEAVLKSRGGTLERAIREMLGDATAAKLYEHPLVNGLYKGAYRVAFQKTRRGGSRWAQWLAALRQAPSRMREPIRHRRALPSYIPDRTFAVALLEIAVQQAGRAQPEAFASVTEARQMVEGNMQIDEQAKNAVLSAINVAGFDPSRIIAELENWYRGAMDRASGWYRRQTQWIILAVAFGVTVALNANSITLAQYLYRTPSTREALVARAGAGGVSATAPSAVEFRQIRADLDTLRLPLGLPADIDTFEEAVDLGRRQFFGWLITAFAVSLGAPFWFDLLNKIMVIRSTVKPREKSQEEGSEDRPRTEGSVTASTTWTPLPITVGSVPANAPVGQLPPGPSGKLQC